MAQRIIEETEIAQHNLLVLSAAKNKLIHMVKAVGANEFCEKEIENAAIDIVENYSWNNPDLTLRSNQINSHALAILNDIQMNFWAVLVQTRRERSLMWNLLMWIQNKCAEWRVRQIAIVCRRVRERFTE